MFPKKQRIYPKEFSIILKKGKNSQGTFFRAKTIRVDTSPSFAVVIAKKTIKRRVDRNREKRRILHILRSLSLTPPCVGIIWVTKSTTDLSHQDLTLQIIQTLGH